MASASLSSLPQTDLEPLLADVSPPPLIVIHQLCVSVFRQSSWRIKEARSEIGLGLAAGAIKQPL